MMSVDNNGGSGGLAEYIFRSASEKLFNIPFFNPVNSSESNDVNTDRKYCANDLVPLVYKPGRNPDISELELKTESNILMRFGRVYGFRNIQGLILKLRTARCDLDYVEVMACPRYSDS